VTTQYLLRYVPDTGPASEKLFRNIKIVVPDLPQAKVRFRKGYYPFAP
jgi:phenylalanyl-tRNA synthetase alpha subunit